MTMVNEVADVRTAGQLGKELAYDAGVVIWGSKKQVAELREELRTTMGQGSVSKIMNRLETVNPALAAQYCVKDNILKKFDFEAEYKQGTEIQVSINKKLILDRIAQKPTGKDEETRRHFIHAIEEIEQILRAVKTFWVPV